MVGIGAQGTDTPVEVTLLSGEASLDGTPLRVDAPVMLPGSGSGADLVYASETCTLCAQRASAQVLKSSPVEPCGWVMVVQVASPLLHHTPVEIVTTESPRIRISGLLTGVFSTPVFFGPTLNVARLEFGPDGRRWPRFSHLEKRLFARPSRQGRNLLAQQ